MTADVGGGAIAARRSGYRSRMGFTGFPHEAIEFYEQFEAATKKW
jgi:hypothetical protein